MIDESYLKESCLMCFFFYIYLVQPTITAISAAAAAASTSAGLADRVASVAISAMVRLGCLFLLCLFFNCNIF